MWRVWSVEGVAYKLDWSWLEIVGGHLILYNYRPPAHSHNHVRMVCYLVLLCRLFND
jgi:hypothetical protein